MLFKKYLEQIPVMEPSVKIQKGSKYSYNKLFLTSHVDESKRCGSVLVVEVYDQKKALKRFFCDGKNWLVLEHGVWRKRSPILRKSYFDINESEESQAVSMAFFKEMVEDINQGRFCSTGTLIQKFIIGGWARSYAYAKLKREAVWMDRQRIINSAPSVPAGFEKYCIENLFKHRYARAYMNGETAIVHCLSCGHKEKVSKLPRQKGKYDCPKCGKALTVYRQEYLKNVVDREKIVVLNRNEDVFYKCFYNLFCAYDEAGKPKVTKYEYWIDYRSGDTVRNFEWTVNMGWAGFTERQNDCADSTYVYTDNLDNVYSEGKHLGLNLKRLKGVPEIPICRLFTVAATTDTAWQLYKIGLFRLAAYADLLNPGSSFQEVVGLSKNYLPALRKCDIGIGELKIIKHSPVFMKEEEILKIKHLLNDSKDQELYKKIDACLEYMSLKKLLNYFSKQAAILGKTNLSTMLTYYLDYLSMWEQRNKIMPDGMALDITEGSRRFPKDIKKAHDSISKQLELKDDKEKDGALGKLADVLEGMYSFCYDDLMIVIPKSTADFVYEGSVLGHCVGSQAVYRNNHIKGVWLTFFIRKMEEPEKPFYTFTVYAKSLILKECFGKGHKLKTEKVARFITEFQKSVTNKIMLSQIAS